MNIETETLTTILKILSLTENEEIGCEDCFQEMDRFVEMLHAGQDPTEVMPLVQQHLEICHCCHEEFDALLAAMKGIDEE